MTTIPFPASMPEEPVELFLDWYKEAIRSSIPEYDVMTLASGSGSARDNQKIPKQVRNDEKFRITDLSLLQV